MNSGLQESKTFNQTDSVSRKSQKTQAFVRELRKEQIMSGALKAPLKKWVDHLENFMDRHALFPRSSRAVVAFSGGPDSVALSLFLKALEARGRYSEVLLVHVHHGYRQDSDQELDWAVEFARFWDFQLRIEKLSPSFWESGTQNFESRARKERYRLLGKYLESGDKLYLGHHIDDSFEWSLHQMLRSTDVNSSLGIPVVNGKRVRPLMAFSKIQLLRFLSLCGQGFCRDESNQDKRFARNWLRQGVVEECRKFSPQYLKNYVFRSNRLAKELGVLRIPEGECGELIDCSFSFGEVWMSTSPENYQDQLFAHFHDFQRVLKRYSTKERGKTRSRFAQLAYSYKKHASFPRGPFHFQGDVQAYLDWGLLFVAHDGQKYWRELDEHLSFHFSEGEESKHFHKMKSSQIPVSALNTRPDFLNWLKESKISFPFIVFAYAGKGGGDQRKIKSLLGPSLTNYPLLPEFSRRLKNSRQSTWWQVGQRFYDRFEKARKRSPNHGLWEHMTFYALKFELSSNSTNS